VSTDAPLPADSSVPIDAKPIDLPGLSSCGNGRPDPGEQCDDGNTFDGDGCTKDCKQDCATCWMCPGCPPVRTMSCGDGRVASNEACDDGNVVSGDGCAGDCKSIEAGFRCPSPGKRCIPICGDGLLVGWEALLDAEPSCDAGDPKGGICGDGLVTGYEECDCGDGSVPHPDYCLGPNDNSYGGCTTKCTWGPFCGDGVVNGPPEQCDLGKGNGTLGRNGCTLGCTRPHFCGDGLLDTDLHEDCDLGDLNGVKIDRQGNPSNDPDAKVLCDLDCRYLLPVL
jgi:cysteine-rich repeat protein